MGLNMAFRGSLAPTKVILASTYIMDRRSPSMTSTIDFWSSTWMLRQSYAKTLSMFFGWDVAKEFLESGIVPGGGNS